MSVKSLQKQLMAAVAMVLVAAIAMSSATFAWFVNNAQVTATSVSVQAATAYSLLISHTNGDTAKWGTTTELSETIGKLTPVSTIGEINEGTNAIVLSAKNGNIEAVGKGDGTSVAVGDVRFVTNTGWKDNYITAVSEISKTSTIDGTNKYFYSDTLYLKAAQEGSIYLDSTGIGIVWAKYNTNATTKFDEASLISLSDFAKLTPIATTDLNNTSTPTLSEATTYNENLASAQALLKTMRVGLLVTKTSSNNTYSRTWHEYQLDSTTFSADTSNTTSSTDTNADGVTNAVSAKASTETNATSATDSTPVTAAINSKTMANTIETYALAGQSNALVKASTNTSADQIATVSANEVVQVDVYLWMEGCDVDTVAAHINDFAGTGVKNFQLGFCLADTSSAS